MKFNRNYALTIQANDGGEVVIEPPFTIDFNIIRNVLTSANICTFRIYNLADKTRARIRKDEVNTGLIKKISFLAGYGDNILSNSFTGNVTRAYSIKEGVNVVTSIESFDGGYAYANANTSIDRPRGYAARSAIRDLMTELNNYGIENGYIGNFLNKLKRKSVYSGNPIDLLNDLTNGSHFIDNGIINALLEDEVLFGNVVSINSESGLLETPMLNQYHLSMPVIFEPRLQIGFKMKLESSTETGYNNDDYTDYKIISLNHVGTISESVAGTAITTIGLYYSQDGLRTVNGK